MTAVTILLVVLLGILVGIFASSDSLPEWMRALALVLVLVVALATLFSGAYFEN